MFFEAVSFAHPLVAYCIPLKVIKNLPLELMNNKRLDFIWH